MEDSGTQWKLGGPAHPSYVPCSLPKAIHCNVILAQRNFRSQKASRSMDKLKRSGTCKFPFLFISPFILTHTPSLYNHKSTVTRLICLTLTDFSKDSVRHTCKTSLEILLRISSSISNGLMLRRKQTRICLSTLKPSPWFKVLEQANHACSQRCVVMFRLALLFYKFPLGR